jgi:hypothetical protein
MTTNTVTKTTEQVIYGMLTENTGAHFLDSGGAYGRNHERNRAKTIEDFEAEPRVAVDISFWENQGVKRGEIMLTQSVYHFLTAALEYDQALDDLFSEFSDLPENESEGWLTLMEAFPTWLAENHGDDYGDRPQVGIENTYNGEDSLSQTIQYARFTLDGGEWVYGEYALVQIHGGCDVRGGYTRPRAFLVGECPDLFDNARLTACCEPPAIPEGVEPFPGMEHAAPQHIWDSTDAGYSWEGQGYPETEPDLFDGHPIVEVFSKDEVVKGQISVLDGVAHCPLCTGPLYFGAY